MAADVVSTTAGHALPRGVAWLGATVVGFAAGTALSTALVGAVGRLLAPVLGGLAAILIYGALIGLIAGGAQALTLPRGAVSWRAWVPACLLGAAVGYAAAAIAGEVLGNAISPATNVVLSEAIIEGTAGASVGLAVALGQWLVLRRLGLPRRRWLVTSALGGALGYAIATAALELFDVPLLRENLILSFAAILGLFLGGAQGLTLWSARRAG